MVQCSPLRPLYPSRSFGAPAPVPSRYPPCAPDAAQSGEQFLDGQFSIGGGSTYQYDGSKGTSLALVTWTWADDRYELAAIRFLSRQVKRDSVLANPNWVFHAERRWNLLHNSAGRLFLGGGAAYKKRNG
jgi:hypothetical protein